MVDEKCLGRPRAKDHPKFFLRLSVHMSDTQPRKPDHLRSEHRREYFLLIGKTAIFLHVDFSR